jgi:hypothetical protein
MRKKLSRGQDALEKLTQLHYAPPMLEMRNYIALSFFHRTQRQSFYGELTSESKGVK